MAIFVSIPAGLFLVIFLLGIVAGVEFFTSMLPYLIILFVIKNLIIDIKYGQFTNENSNLLTFSYIVVDMLRIYIFFKMLYIQADASGIVGIFDFVLLLLIAGPIYLGGEICALLHGKEKEMQQSAALGIPVIVTDILVVVLLFCIYWFFY